MRLTHTITHSLCTDFVDNEALVLNVILSPHEAGTVTFYVPVIILAFEDEDRL